jgi:hypothetical protein
MSFLDLYIGLSSNGSPERKSHNLVAKQKIKRRYNYEQS